MTRRGQTPDLLDQVFGKLVVVDRETDPAKIPIKYQRHAVWYCVCECGEPVWLATGRLRNGITSCGCDDKRKKRRVDLTNERFGSLIVVEECEKVGGKPAWLCQCDCGAYRKVMTRSLKNGSITCCGCKRKSKRGRKSTVLHY